MPVVPRVLLVHAHPDDETITTGGTIAALRARGVAVTVLTATRGEGGEVIPAHLRHLDGDRDGLARVRETEIAEAMTALGVTDHRFLGGTQRRFEDSGMEWGADGHAQAAASMPATALCAAPLHEVAEAIGAVIADVRPHVVITYAANGGYGHPDHVRVHEATVSAVAGAEWRADRLLFVDTPAEAARAAFDPEQPGFAESGFTPVEAIPTKPPVDRIVVAQDITSVLAAKTAALRAHHTQVSVSGDFFALSNGVGMRILDHEYFSFGSGVPVPEGAVDVLDGVSFDEAQQAPRRERFVRKPGVVAYVHAVLLGALIGFLGAMQHLNAHVLHLGDTGVILPWGLVLSLLLAAAGFWHLKTTYRSSGPMLIAAFVLLVLSYALGQPAWLPGSDLVVTGNLRSVVWLLGPMVITAIFAFIPVRRSR